MFREARLASSTGIDRRVLIIALLVAVATLLLFAPAIKYGFVSYDDPAYVLENPRVQHGLALSDISWFFTHAYADNWHPLTWVSHILDVQLFGLNPAGHHATNVILHSLNAALLLLLLHAMTGSLWRSCAVACLFAWHPLRVESVAWVSERKDVLSVFFGLLTFLFYVRYARDRKLSGARPEKNYALALFFFFLGLLSKPMLVTLPVLLFLIDFWPLARLPDRSANTGCSFRVRFETAKPLLVEKIPFFLLSFLSSVMTIWAQHEGGAMSTLKRHSVAFRCENAVTALAKYVAKIFWPANLACFYPFPVSFPTWQLVGAVMFLIFIVVAIVCCLRRWPFVSVGLLWFLVSWLPVSGMMQVGAQAMADRYTYLPSIGILVAVVWGVAQVLPRRVAIVLCFCAIVGFVGKTALQLPVWQNSLTLFRHATEVTEANYTAYEGVSEFFLSAADTNSAIAEYRKAVALYPTSPQLHNNFGQLLARLGKVEEAMAEFGECTRLDPEFAHGYSNLASAQAKLGRWSAANESMSKALQLDSEDADVQLNAAIMLQKSGKVDEALVHFKRAIKLKSQNSAALYAAGRLLVATHPDLAAEYLRRALSLRPNLTSAINDLAWLLATSGNNDVRNGGEALQLAERSCELTGYNDLKSLSVLDASYAECQRFAEAISTAQKVRELAIAANAQAYAAAAEQRIRLYQTGQPYRQQ